MGLISSLTKKYDDKIVFDNFNFRFDSNGMCFLLGNSGVGKTTFLRIIAGLDKDFTGTVHGFGAISMMFQEYRLFPWLSALDNALLSVTDIKPDDVERAKLLLLDLGFSEEETRLKPGALSGGMKQRVSFVRAIIRDSDTVLLDEPFKELDPGIVKVMYDIIEKDCANRLYIIVTHDDIPEDILADANVLHLS